MEGRGGTPAEEADGIVLRMRNVGEGIAAVVGGSTVLAAAVVVSSVGGGNPEALIILPVG
jgi:hypothetical protein